MDTYPKAGRIIGMALMGVKLTKIKELAGLEAH
jgi:hypothetical protein